MNAFQVKLKVPAVVSVIWMFLPIALGRPNYLDNYFSRHSIRMWNVLLSNELSKPFPVCTASDFTDKLICVCSFWIFPLPHFKWVVRLWAFPCFGEFLQDNSKQKLLKSVFPPVYGKCFWNIRRMRVQEEDDGGEKKGSKGQRREKKAAPQAWGHNMDPLPFYVSPRGGGQTSRSWLCVATWSFVIEEDPRNPHPWVATRKGECSEKAVRPSRWWLWLHLLKAQQTRVLLPECSWLQTKAHLCWQQTKWHGVHATVFFPKCLEWRNFGISPFPLKSKLNFWGWFSSPSHFWASLHFQLNCPTFRTLDPVLQSLCTVGRSPSPHQTPLSSLQTFVHAVPLSAELFSDLWEAHLSRP